MADEWYYESFGTEQGPVEFTRLLELVSKKQLVPTDRVRQGADAVWQPAREVAALFPNSSASTDTLESLESLDELTFTAETAPPENSDVVTSFDDLNIELTDDSALRDDDVVSSFDDMQIELVDAAASEPASAPSSGDDDQWFCQIAGFQLGPMPEHELKLLAKKGEIGPQTMVRSITESQWAPAVKHTSVFQPSDFPTLQPGVAAPARNRKQLAKSLAAAKAANGETTKKRGKKPRPTRKNLKVNLREESGKSATLNVPVQPVDEVEQVPPPSEPEPPKPETAPEPPKPKPLELYFRKNGDVVGPLEAEEFRKLWSLDKVGSGDEIRIGEEGEFTAPAKLSDVVRQEQRMQLAEAGVLGLLTGGDATTAASSSTAPPALPTHPAAASPKFTPPTPAKKAPKVKRAKRASSGGSLFDNLDLKKLAPLAAVLGGAVVLFGAWKLIGSSSYGKLPYTAYAEITNKLREMRTRKAPENEWSAFADESTATIKTHVDKLEKIASAKNRIEQELLWAGRDYLNKMLTDARDEVSKNEMTFVKHMETARKMIGDESLPSLKLPPGSGPPKKTN